MQITNSEIPVATISVIVLPITGWSINTCQVNLASSRCALLLVLSVFVVPVFSQDWVYTTRPGDNLWNLSKNYLKHVSYWIRLQELNQISDPYRILPGTRIRMPIAWLRQQPAPAKTLKVRGTVTLIPSAGTGPVPLTVANLLVVGDKIVTSSESSATLMFANGSRLLIQEQTELVMDTLSAYGKTGMVDTRIRLQSGRVESNVLPNQGPASRYHIITPGAVAAVRGTDFRVGTDQVNKVSRSEVLRGTVAVKAAGITRNVEAGFGTLVEAGKPPAEPVELLQPPDLSHLPEVTRRLLLMFEWSPVNDAVTYRIQVFANKRLERLLHDKVINQPRLQWDAPPDGDYLFRVRAIDTLGLEGMNADHEFRIDARPVAPTLLLPLKGAAMHGQAPQFWWSIPEKVSGFHFQLARDSAFQDLVANAEEIRDSRLQLGQELAPGTYYWRLASRSEDGEVSAFGDAQQFRILAVPAAISTEGAEIGEAQLNFSWAPAADAVHYEFQLADDNEFKDLIMDKKVNDTGLSIDPLKSGTYYFRVRGISGEGVTGPYSPVNRIEVPPATDWALLLLPLLPLLMLL